MTIAQAVAKRTQQLLKQQSITQYKLEKKTGIQHGTMQCIMNGRTKAIELNTVMIIAKGVDMSILQFLDNEIFEAEDLELEY